MTTGRASSGGPPSGQPVPLRHLDHGLSVVPAEPHRRGRLPFPLGPFVGRFDDLARADTLLAHSRLLTLTGSGGCGKTRLAIEVARRHEPRFAGGVWFVDFTSVLDGRLVLAEIADVLGVLEPERGRTLLDALIRELDERDVLLVVDGCEYVVGPVGEELSALLEASGTLRVIATSREPLAIPGETVLTVPPLDHEDAVKLFIERAARARSGRAFDDRELETIDRICDRLDCLPLAVELAAAKAGSLPIGRIAEALDDRVRLLSRRGGSAPARQRTMRASFEWSHDLLTESEARLLADLSVFRGGFGLDDALAVCPGAAIETVASLVERGLLSLAEIPSGGQRGDARYRMLETIREFAAERLAARPRAARDLRQRHARHYLALAEAAEPNLSGADQDAWLTTLEIEVDNLRAALTEAAERPDDEILERLAVALTPYWLERSQWSECRHWLVAAARSPVRSRPGRARLLNRRCYLELWAGDVAMVPTIVAESLALLDGLDEPTEQGRAHGFRMVAVSWVAGPEAARSEFDLALALARRGGDRWGQAMLLAFFAATRLFQDRRGETRAMFDEAIEIARAGGDRRTLRLAEAFAACAAITEGRLDEAARRAESALHAAADADHATPMILALFVQSWALTINGDVAGARARAVACLEVARRSEESPVFDGLALWAKAQADLADGAVREAVPLLEEARRLTAADRMWAVLPALTLAEVAAGLDDGKTAAAALREAESIAEAGGLVWAAGRLALTRARITDDPAQRDALVRDGLDRARAAGDQLALVDGIELLADIAEERGDDAMAVRLWAGASSARAALGYARRASSEPPHRPRLEGAIQRLGAERASNLWAEGEALSVDEAVAYATRRHGRRGRPSIGWYSLTPSELEVTYLVAEHRTNPEIARLLFISRATVKTHLVHIFAKLGIGSRSELAAEATRRRS